MSGIVTTTGITDGLYYLATVPTTKTFTLSATKGGAALSLTTNGSATVQFQSALASTDVNNLLKKMFDNGAKLPQAETVFLCGSAQKVALSACYQATTLNQPTMTRNVGGVAIDTLVTDFGTFGVMLDRWMPDNEIAVVDLSVCSPVFLNIPDKGLLFTEELARVGSSRKFQLYGEVGLEYGPETYHGLLKNLT